MKPLGTAALGGSLMLAGFFSPEALIRVIGHVDPWTFLVALLLMAAGSGMVIGTALAAWRKRRRQKPKRVPAAGPALGVPFVLPSRW